MDLSKLPPGMIGQLAGMVEDYILKNQKRYSPRAVPLTGDQKAAVQGFFASEILDQTRLLVLQGERIQDPSFYTMARMMGIKDLPSFADTAAVTFVDVVVAHEEATASLLFHELVHVVQYAQLGTKDFASRYVEGFIRGGSYDEIPLEKNAYQLESRFSRDQSQVFSVADEVQRWASGEKT
ncbi:MAG TPA: hypothetical protein VEW69_00075 [Alphaproteobacteria bacterium]|nr:hypothetical protein [Alphaproteobacteria bacterium]